MKIPLLKDESFLADVRRALDSGTKRLWWLGQSGFLIACEGQMVLLDPYLSDSLTRKYANTDKPHVRITDRVVAPEAIARLGRLIAVTSSHAHTDHLDAETLLPLLSANPEAKLVIPAANRWMVLERLGPGFESRLVELDDGTGAQVAGVAFHGVAAAHNTVDRDEHGRCKYLGYVMQWAGSTFYHSGDTLRHDALAPVLRPGNIDVAFLPINGNLPERRVAGNLDGPEAAQLARDISARLVIPCHFDLFQFNTASPEPFVRECTRLHQSFRILANGEGIDWPLK